MTPMSSNTLGAAAGTIALALLAFSSQAAESASKGPNYFQDDFPFQGACITAKGPGTNVAMKGFAIRIGNDANLLWDTDLLRMAAGWTGGYISGKGVVYNASHGEHPSIVGTQAFGTRPEPGWANGQGQFVDRRAEPFGPLPASDCRWNGMHVQGMRVVLAYTVLGTSILEQPSSVQAEGQVGFIRSFQIQTAAQDLKASIAVLENATPTSFGNGIQLVAGTNALTAQLVQAPPGVKLDQEANSRVVLTIPKGTKDAVFSVVIWGGSPDNAPKSAALAAQTKPAVFDVTQGGPAHWPEPVVVKGVLNTSATPDGAYATDSITAPTPNPWNRRVRFGGMDLFADGKRAALCTHEGDVWIVDGLDEKLENLKWRRFASGQYETLGLAIVNDVIYTSGRDQITRYHDLNGDGEADYYENFNNEIMSTEGFHEFVFDLQTDSEGNFYFAKANPVNSGGGGFGNNARTPGNGTVCSHSGGFFKVSQDGKRFEIVAHGLRAPNGIGVSPSGQLTASDNEGTWVPSTPIHWISKPGQFLGVINRLTPKALADTYVPPLAWLSHNDYDNSGGGQIWVTSKQWGPFEGELLHESYGKSRIFLVLKEQTANGLMQGGVVRFPLKFTSSCMRAKFGPKDGQLYVAGLSEWQSNAARPTGFDRVRYTGKKVYSVRGLKVVHGGVQLTFTEPLSAESVADLQNWTGKRWNYERAERYGSPEFTLTKDDKGNWVKGREAITITKAQLSADARTVTVDIADFKPVMQQFLKWNLQAADGTPVAQEIQHTVHVIP
jgi:glucose/arabinose dehydrogenase